MRRTTFERLFIATAALAVAAYACGAEQTDDESDDGAEAGSPSVGGASGRGGASSRGSGAGEGGESSGGSAGNGGAIGGTDATGGTDTMGGSSGKGGTAGMGGSAGMGGTGGTSGTGGKGGSGGAGGAGALPLDMFVMFDRSGSMRECLDGELAMPGSPCPSVAPSRWENAAAGLLLFFQDPAVAGLGVALRFFPHDVPAPGCNNASTGCSDVACGVPLLDLARLTAEAPPLDAHEGALAATFVAADPSQQAASTPSTGGPTYPALAGAHLWAGPHQAAHPTNKVIVVFVTDGIPNGCNEDADAIFALAASGLAASGVETYVVGLGVPDVSLTEFFDGIALAGGTNEAFPVADGLTASTELLAALRAIHARN